MAMDQEKQKVYRRAYYQSHKEERKQYSKAYRKSHKEQRNAYNRAWRKANPEKVKLSEIARSDKNKIRWTAYRKSNPAKIRGYRKTYIKGHLTKLREKNRKHRALKRTLQVQTINEKIIYLRDGWICQICKKRVDKRFKYPNPMCASLDHIMPLSKGGTHIYANVQLAHFACNSGKCAKVLPQGEQMRLF